jgi:hypothetical protein
MSQVITTGNTPKALWPGIKHWFGKEYDQHETQWTDLFEQETSDKAYEEVVENPGFGLAAMKPQTESIIYDTDSQGYTKRFTHAPYALGFMVSAEEMRDNLYAAVAKQRSPDLAFSMRQTKENVCAAVYDRAFTSAYAGGDGKELCATDHPTLVGSQSNELTNSADLSEAAIEDLIIQIMDAKDSRGRKINLQPQSLHVATANWFEANRILKSVLQYNTAENAINVLRATNALPKGIKVNNYFTDPDAWFIRTNARRGMKHFQRDPLEFGEDSQFDNKVQKYAAYERYVASWADWRGVYGTPGA